ncbi:MAG: hypothetical protein WHV44_14940 [Anaerolineales bacterium]
MDLEQLAKRIDWLEKERRKDVDTIAALQERINGYEGAIGLYKEQIKDLEARVAKVSSATSRLDQFDSVVAQYRAEWVKAIEDAEKKAKKREEEMENRRRAELDNINKALAELRKPLETLPELRKGIQARAEEDTRLHRMITEVESRFLEVDRAYEDIKRNQRILEEGRKQDVKRLTDLQGETTALRKRIEDTREKTDLQVDMVRHLDTRINELLATEAERRQDQTAFIERQSLAQVERDRVWREWQARFESIIKQTSTLDEQILKLEEMQRAVKRAQDSFDDINQRLERRINEITEMQRLAEDRFRQEWVTFKADDQKRWTNFNLTQDETARELRAGLVKVNERFTGIEDAIQTITDQFGQTTELTEQSLQELMNWAHEWLTNSERITGRSRAKR